MSKRHNFGFDAVSNMLATRNYSALPSVRNSHVEKSPEGEVKLFYNSITLNNGGWKTVTTKSRINDALPVGFYLYQQDFEWFVNTPDGALPFVNGMIIVLEKTEDLIELSKRGE